ncbi:hypothetical protein [Devosia rhizoryzae]|uniref:Uncharacterized protein n=1 Tax=Devosia rhizoryzae TaxID=2774137 RepID=A0ABX7C3D9_9HYPH|nr:hypothetical protein [Devosia rhizoryzae]QQR38723.1 hypothetical protein JI748_13280 [Devosia rhizoryzae]
MTRLPDNSNFNEADFPELGGVFRGLDQAIASLIAADPAFRPKSARKRPARSDWTLAGRRAA